MAVAGDGSVRYIAKHKYIKQSAHTILSKAISVSTCAHTFSRSFCDDGDGDGDDGSGISGSRCDGVTLARPST